MFIDRFVRFVPRSGLKKALCSFNKGDYRKACKEFESYLSKSELRDEGQEQEMVRMYMVESYNEYSRELSVEGKFEEAALQLEKAVELQPGYADIHYSLAKFYDRLGRNADSRDCIKRAIEINPNYFKARIMLARNYRSEGNNKLAIEELKTSLSCAPTFFVDQVNELIELIWADTSIEKQDEYFHKLLEERPSSSQVSKQIALQSMQNGDYDYAMAELKKTLSMHPNYPDLHNLLGIAYANKGMIDDALMEFEISLKLHPDYLKAHLNMALTLYEKSAMEESMKHLEKVLKLDPENELAKNLLSELQPALENR
ncbi:MAG: tetratricopeptide repeat protein [Candidatus Krumholzibacteria bacterium]|nr:tetratricopeptide repeat protein [Candidatus Krumholzibacteria bacterium]